MHNFQTYSFYRVVSVLYSLLLATYMASAAVSYSIGSSITPQGKFFGADGMPVSVSVANSKITFSGKVTKIGNYAFHNCSDLKSFELPSDVTEVGFFAFSNNDKLTSSIYNKTIFARLPMSAESCTVKDGTTTIASAAFRKCTKLTSVKLPSSITTIGESAFAECTSLTSITIPQNTKKIGEYAFFNCKNLSSIFVESTEVANIEASAFEGIDKSKCVLFVPNGKTNDFAQWGFTNIVAMPSSSSDSPAVVKINGSYTSSTFNALNDYINSIDVQIVDLTNATKVEGTFKLDNKNVLFKTTKKPAELKLNNTDNVIVNGTCEKLVITDGCPFGSSEQFQTNSASYQRAMTSNWGTICLPFTIHSDDNVQYYTTGTIDDSDILTLKSSTSVPSGQPAIFKRKTSSNLSILVNGSKITVTTEPVNNDNTTGSQDILLQGTYTHLELTTEGLYYIAKDKFWLKTEGTPLTVNPFRAWFTCGSKHAQGRSLSIEEEESQTSNIKALQSIVEGTAQYFDEQGRPQEDLQPGMNIIRMPDGSTKKVWIK